MKKLVVLLAAVLVFLAGCAEKPDKLQVGVIQLLEHPSLDEVRMSILEELSAGLHQEFIDSHKGMKAHVLFESSEKDGMMAGYTENYIRVERPFDASLTGKIAEVTL